MFLKMRMKLIPKQETVRFCLLIILTVICVLLTIVRKITTGNSTFSFLNWNLFLAAVPWLVSMIAASRVIAEKSKILTVVLFFIWFLTFPNAPYIITDLYYLNDHPSKMFWYDLIMILLFAWTGLLFGFFSLARIEGLLIRKLTKTKSVIVIVVILFAGAFGIYLGRDLRWNSWDIFLEPREFFLDVLDRFIKPFGHGRTWGFTFLMGSFLNIIYWSFRLIQKKESV